MIDYPHSPTSSRITSRRAKAVETNLVRQIAFFGVLTVIVAAVFVVVVIPNVIKFMSKSNAMPAPVVTTIPPQVPTIATPTAATNSAELTLAGFSEKGNQVVVLDNGQELTRAAAKDDGSFSIDLTLQAGDNSLTAYAINTNQQQSAVSSAYVVSFSNQAPKLTLTSPQDNQSVVGSNNQKVSIAGTTDPNTKLTVNDQLIFVKSDGSFSTTFQLNTGDNPLDFKAISSAGNLTEQKITVHFSL